MRLRFARQTGCLAVTVEPVRASKDRGKVQYLKHQVSTSFFIPALTYLKLGYELLIDLQLARSSAPSKVMMQEAYLWHSLEEK